MYYSTFKQYDSDLKTVGVYDYHVKRRTFLRDMNHVKDLLKGRNETLVEIEKDKRASVSIQKLLNQK